MVVWFGCVVFFVWVGWVVVGVFEAAALLWGFGGGGVFVVVVGLGVVFGWGGLVTTSILGVVKSDGVVCFVEEWFGFCV